MRSNEYPSSSGNVLQIKAPNAGRLNICHPTFHVLMHFVENFFTFFILILHILKVCVIRPMGKKVKAPLRENLTPEALRYCMDHTAFTLQIHQYPPFTS